MVVDEGGTAIDGIGGAGDSICRVWQAAQVMPITTSIP
jgi:hypothetical protein